MASLCEFDRAWLARPFVTLQLAGVPTTGKRFLTYRATKQRLATLLAF